ncbi:putative disease resistance RPP13-like protein 1-like protein [Corchorus capsularis]|uniref:Putative disease resistance RPP13-like protein 1-like protein n=1 Tax=Corchorus capsularis TaxID=210143 RepID=A0A1R3J395_COCAP|nr:putative disease resistance RPP13-like protein 1-like protein [Corchorus capsularis]
MEGSDTRFVRENRGRRKTATWSVIQGSAYFAIPYKEKLPSNLEKSLSSHGNLPAKLQCLEIRDCQNLARLSSKNKLPHGLQRLQIDNCPKLTCLSSSRNLPVGLKELTISRCGNLLSITQGPSLLNNICLESLIISDCKKLHSLPEGLNGQENLKRVWIIYCPSLASVAESWSQAVRLKEFRLIGCHKLQASFYFKGLEELEISDCPGVTVSLDDRTRSLTSLYIADLNVYKPMAESGFHLFINLKRLTIERCCPDTISFPKYELRSIALTHLTLRDFPKLRFLSSNGFEYIGSSLKYLSIIECPKLRFLPRKDAIPNLVQLQIDDCPLLKKQLRHANSFERLKIAHVSYVQIDDLMLDR